MVAVTETSPDVSPLVTAALLLAARKLLIHHDLSHPKASEILESTGAGRARAYELAGAIPGVVAALVHPPGRPSRPEPEPPPDAMAELSQKVIAYLIEQPGCVTTKGRRRHYTKGYICFVLDLVEEHGGVDLAALAEAVAVPLPTLRDWLCGERPEPDAPDDETIAAQDAASAKIETVIHEWDQWAGPFVPFCNHLREHLRIEWGRSMIAGILDKVGVRTPRRRPGRSCDDGTLSGAFETFFPGAQWQGDGTPLVVHVGSEHFGFNVEPMVDTNSGAFVGLSVRDAEDGAAVIEAFTDGVETTGSAPLAVELDGRLSNHTEEVDQALGETIRIRSTPGRPQSNPHVEGGHGLFQQVAPPLVIDAGDPREAARQVLTLVLTTWARTLNNKPRTDRGGRSRVDLYREDEPTENDVERARKALRERARRQERALQTRRARKDPTVRAVVDQQWDRLGLDDPEGRVRDAISSFPLDAVLAAIGTFEGKREVGTLPPGVDARYLYGIVRNITEQDEGQHITEALLRVRLEARDVMLARLVEARDALLASTTEPDTLLRVVLDRAMGAHRRLDRLFWLDVAADLIRDREQAHHPDLVRSASRRIHASFVVPYRDRLAAVRFLAEQVVSLA
ncbi:MAG: hypothetical protein JRH11_21805 [Deltaproteobacteria bacterium]|nr:hypothetical protein [Deltaproteobacteria bacterium]